MKDAFQLAWRALWRGRIVALAVLALAFVRCFVPSLVRSDGSAHGLAEMFVRSVYGSGVTVVLLTTLVTACGYVAGERRHRRLALALVRPVPAWRTVLGAHLAFVAFAAIGLAGAALCVLLPDAKAFPDCRHRYAPTLPPPEIAAARILTDYLRDPKTPEAVRNAPRAALLTLLTTKETDRYDTIRPGETLTWPCDVPALTEALRRDGSGLAVAVRFSTQFELRQPVAGRFAFGGLSATVSNNTQAVLEIPFAAAKDGAAAAPGLSFANTGKSTVMIRPRRDLELIAPGDAFAWNLARATVENLAFASLLAAFGLFLSAALSRPVAVFTALVTLVTVAVAPDAVAQFPDEFHAAWSDRFALAVARAVTWMTHALTEPTPVADLATARAIETAALVRTVFLNGILGPLFWLALTACALRRQDGTFT